MKTTQEKLTKAEELVTQLKAKLETEKNKMETITINNIEYELKQHDNGKKLSEIIIPKGWRLLLPSEAMMLYERNLIDNTFWFYVQQTNKIEKEKGNVAWFYADSAGAGLDCNGDPSVSYGGLGVILCKEGKKMFEDLPVGQPEGRTQETAVVSSDEQKEKKWITHEVKMLYDGEFHGIDCMEDEDRYGFFGYYNGDLSHPDYRPSSAIFLNKKDAEHLWNIFKQQLNQAQDEQ